jgi:hypothetical protein
VPNNGRRMSAAAKTTNHSTIPASLPWGYGAAPLVAPSTRKSTETVALLSDFHAPWHDEAAVKSALRLLKALEPDRVVLNGDIADFFQLSRFNVALERIDHLQEEIDGANAIRRAIRDAVPNAHLVETLGNHDERIITSVEKNARALTSLRAIEPRSLFLYDELEIDWYPGAGFLQWPHYLVKHGTLIRQEGATAKAELAAAGISGISGHTHRLAKYVRAGYAQREWTEQGCLCRLDPDYVTGAPNWQQGMAIGYFSTKSDAFSVDLVNTFNGRLHYGGRSF